MSSFKFIKSKKNLSSSNSNVQIPSDNDYKMKNMDSFNGAPAQPAQSFTNISEPKIEPQPKKKGFEFIKKKQNNPANTTNNLEQSNNSINSNEQKFNENNNYIPENDLASLINNTNDLLNFGKIQTNNDSLGNSNNNVNINNLGEANYQNYSNFGDDSNKNSQYERSFNNNFNLMNQDFPANNNNNYEEREKEIEKPTQKKSGFSFLNKKGKKSNKNITNMNNSSESDSNKNVPYIANKTPLSSSMSDKPIEKRGSQSTSQGFMNINQAAAETEKDLEIENSNENENEYYMDMNSLNDNQTSTNNNFNTYEAIKTNYKNNYSNKTFETPKPRKEEIKEKELSEISINSKYKIKKNNFINDYIKYINELHSKKLSLQNKENELSALNAQKENLVKEEQKAIDDNDYEKADNIENKIKDIKNKSNQILSKIEQETNSLMEIKKKEIQINNNLLSYIDEVSTGYTTLKN